jgi:GNAT superfamily N-acetyltransferase
MPDPACQIEGQFRPEILSESAIPECIGLTIRSFPLEETAVQQWFERRVTKNPWQKTLPGIGLGIRHGGRLVAFRTLFGQPWWLNGKSTTLGFAAHTAVDPDYRRYGLATMLIRESTKFAAITGSTSAGNITQKAYKKLGYVEVGKIDNDFFRTRVSFRGSLERRLGKKMGLWLGVIADLGLRMRDSKIFPGRKFHMQEVTRCDREFDTLWESAKADYASCLEHSSTYLNWRLFDFPTCPLYLASLKDASGILRAFGIWHIQAFDESVKMAVLRDIFSAIDDHEARYGLFQLLLGRWRKEGISWVSMEVASPWITALFRELGYEHVPSHGNRYYIHSQTALPPQTIHNWYRSGIDGDYFDMPMPG